MQIETLRDVLHWTQEFHRHLSQCLTHCASENIDERARMILLYLSDHEKVLTKVISGFETSGDQRALNTWCYEYINHHPIIQHEHCGAPFSALDAEQVMDVIVDQHQQIIELYRFIGSRAGAQSATELLDTIKTLEEHEVMRMVHSANRFRDM